MRRREKNIELDLMGDDSVAYRRTEEGQIDICCVQGNEGCPHVIRANRSGP